ncbi:MAG: energy-coupling factor transporter transmembrane component T family protein [Candidatus Bruticola sp.]
MRLETKTWALLPLAAALNITGGWLAALLKLPLYLDSLGTILAACLGGPAAGAAAALISSIISAAANSPIWLCFLPPALLIGLAAGYLSRQGFMRTPWLASFMGLILGLLAAVTSAPIAAYLLHGSSGGGTDLIVAAFRLAGFSTVHACFAQSLTVDPADKIICCLLAQAILSIMPLRLRGSFQNGADLGEISISSGSLATGSRLSNECYSQQTLDYSPENLGFYQKGSGFLHRRMADTKWLLFLAASAAAFYFPLTIQTKSSTGSPQYLLLAYLPTEALLLWVLSLVGGIAVAFSRTLLWTALPISASMIIINGFLGSPDTTFTIKNGCIISWSMQSANLAAQTALRITIICEAALILLFTTSPENLLRSLESKGIPSKLAYAILAAVNSAPRMLGRVRRIMEIQATRAMPWGGSVIQRLYRLRPLLIPLVLTSAYEAEQTALTLESRGFGSTSKRTYLEEQIIPLSDKIIQYILVACLLLILAQAALKLYQSTVPYA